ncbi:MAG TPA: hypothetical protein VKU19_24665 [Bryobacteraceae bacterium]|nr:hypothetical protein [Bryobacteraceae bacterium]
MRRFVVAVVLASSFLATLGSAQSASQLLQRAIYFQETSGDLDSAIPLYRQIVNSSQDRAIAAQAQFRLTQSLIAKGDLNAASAEFGKLVQNFADSGKLVAAMTAQAKALGANGVPQLLGSFQNGRYHHNLTGAELTLPSDWSVRNQASQAEPDGGDRIDLFDSTGRARAFFWIKQTATADDQVANRLQQRMEYKLKSQRQDSEAVHGFTFRPEGPQSGLISGHQSLSAVGDYTDQKGERMTEYQVFIQTNKIAAFFSGRSKLADSAAERARFDQIVNSIVIP